jgi:glycosyltransferase involved in cell wall biosynthesis
MLRAFVLLGAEVTLLSPRIEGPTPYGLSGVVAHALTAPRKGDAEIRAGDMLALNEEVERTLSTLGPFDVVYERHALHAHAAMEFAHARGIPGLLEVNAPLLDEQARHRTLALPDAAATSARRAMAAAHAVVAVSPAVAAHCRALGAGTVAVVPNAVSPERFASVAAASGPFTLGFVGSLKPWHDVATAISAFALLRRGPVPEARMLIVGDGPERERLSEAARRSGVAGAVEFAGAVPADRIPEHLARMHVGLAPYAASDDFYFSPLKLYEYMAAGLAVVASRVGHLPEVVDDGRTGLLTPPGDAHALAGVLARLAASPEMRGALGAAARAEVLANRTWGQVARRVLDLAQARRTAA